MRTGSHMVWPGDPLICELPSDYPPDALVALEPIKTNSWPEANFVKSVASRLTLINNTDFPLKFYSSDHMCRILGITSPVVNPPPSVPKRINPKQDGVHQIELVKLNVDGVLPVEFNGKFKNIMVQYSPVFNTYFTGYNGYLGAVCSTVNTGKTPPPQSKGRLPSYTRDKMCLLQDFLEDLKVLV